MKIYLDSTYIKHYQKRISSNIKLRRKTTERIKLFREDPRHSLLKDHGLTGTNFRHRGFWITGDIRIIYERICENEILFLDIGSHNQVY